MACLVLCGISVSILVLKLNIFVAMLVYMCIHVDVTILRRVEKLAFSQLSDRNPTNLSSRKCFLSVRTCIIKCHIICLVAD